MALTIHIISDVICPWCFVGKRRLEKALEAVDGRVRLHWMPFELNPRMPKDGVDRELYRKAKFGSSEKSRELDARLTAVGMEVGIDFGFARIARTPNTFDAHRLLWFARQHRAEDAVAEGLFRAYFCEGRDVGERAVLCDVAQSCGFTAAEFLESGQGTAEVRDELLVARRLKVEGVPYFIFNQRLAVSGAQPPDMLKAAIQEASLPPAS